MPNYSLKIIIKGEKYTLNNADEPMKGFLDDDIGSRSLIRAYVAHEFRDKVDKLEDIEKIDYYHGRKKLKSFDYTMSTEEFMKKFIFERT